MPKKWSEKRTTREIWRNISLEVFGRKLNERAFRAFVIRSIHLHAGYRRFRQIFIWCRLDAWISFYEVSTVVSHVSRTGFPCDWAEVGSVCTRATGWMDWILHRRTIDTYGYGDSCRPIVTINSLVFQNDTKQIVGLKDTYKHSNAEWIQESPTGTIEVSFKFSKITVEKGNHRNPAFPYTFNKQIF